MNAISMLIGLTALILLGVFTFSFSSMKGNTSIKEKAKLRQELALLEQMSITDVQPLTSEPDPVQAELEQLRIEKEELEAELMSAEQQRLAQEQAARLQQEAEQVTGAEAIEPQIDPSDRARLEKRARLVSQAMVMATLEQYFPPPDGFCTIRIINYENVQSGVTLAVRRNTGIVGQMVVSTVEGEKAIADVLGHTFLGGEVDLQVGDELILPPL